MKTQAIWIMPTPKAPSEFIKILSPKNKIALRAPKVRIATKNLWRKGTIHPMVLSSYIT